MNSEQRKTLGKIILATAKYYSRQVDQDVISMMLDDLENYDFEKVMEGYRKYRSSAENKFFPLPAQIIGMINPELTKNESAIALADQVIKLISSKGYVWEIGIGNQDELFFEGKGQNFHNFQDALASYVGKENAKAILARSTWKSLCDESNESPVGVFKKQLVDSLTVQLKRNNSENKLFLDEKISKLLEVKEV